MAAPRHRFGAHDGSTFLAAHVNEGCEPILERFGLHVIGITAKACVAPAGVRRVLARMPQTAERGQGNVFDILRFQRMAKRVTVELRVMARTWHSANVRKACDSVGMQQCEEALD